RGFPDNFGVLHQPDAQARVSPTPSLARRAGVAPQSLRIAARVPFGASISPSRSTAAARRPALHEADLMTWVFILPFLLISAGLTIWAAFRLRSNQRKARQIEETKQSTIEDLREGYSRIKGTVVARGELLHSPMSN